MYAGAGSAKLYPSVQTTNPPITAIKSTQRDHSARGDFFKTQSLYLGDGTFFSGQAPAWQDKPAGQSPYAVALGEVVFNTGMTGYTESLTDPSYAGQILVFTYPLIGNYGVAPAAAESGRIQVSGVIMSELAPHWNHSGSDRSLLAWLREQNIPLLTGVDTRALTKHLRAKGTMLGAISPKPVSLKGLTAKTRFVSIKEPVSLQPEGRKTVILVDCGAKDNIQRSLLRLGLHIRRVPYDYDYTAESYDGIFLSNGPGDPTDYRKTIKILKKALKTGKPTFGICLGNQLLALAAGAKTYKLPFGHRGHNQPCIDLTTQSCVITSQNHGYAIDEKSLPKDWRVLYRNLNDHSVEGIQHATKPFWSVQFHPEASPGPTDTAWLFERFYDTL